MGMPHSQQTACLVLHCAKNWARSCLNLRVFLRSVRLVIGASSYVLVLTRARRIELPVGWRRALAVRSSLAHGVSLGSLVDVTEASNSRGT